MLPAQNTRCNTSILFKKLPFMLKHYRNTSENETYVLIALICTLTETGAVTQRVIKGHIKSH